jgi:hypothetical protein
MSIKKGYGANIKYSKYGPKGVKPTSYAGIKSGQTHLIFER